MHMLSISIVKCSFYQHQEISGWLGTHMCSLADPNMVCNSLIQKPNFATGLYAASERMCVELTSCYCTVNTLEAILNHHQTAR